MNRPENLFQPPEYTADMIGDMVEDAYKRAEMMAVIDEIMRDNYDPDRLRELLEADREGRVKLISPKAGQYCGNCVHFIRDPGMCIGRCDIKPDAVNRYGQKTGWEFRPRQSAIACKKFDPAKKGEQHENQT